MVAPDKVDPATPTDSHFAVAVRGYNQRQVDERLTRLSDDLKAAARSRDDAVATSAELTKALSYAQKELADAKAGLVRMTSSPSGAGAMAERVRMMMQLAEEEIAELKSKAGEDAESTRGDADNYAHSTRRAAEKEAKDRQAEHEAQIAAARADSERLDKEAAAARAKLDAEAKERREEADRKAEGVIKDKKAKAEQAAAAAEAEAKERLGKIVTDAEKRRSDAEAQAKQALDFRRKVTERMTATNVALQEALKHLTPDAPAEGTTPDSAQSTK